MNLDELYMSEALDLARLGMGRTLPNPMVGALVVKNNQIIGRGFHQKFGLAHAEVNAILDAEKNGHDVSGADLYCTLEPCSHLHKKTPPCAQMVAGKNIRRMIIATLDQNPVVRGNGVKILEQAGVKVEIGVLEEEAISLNRIFFHHIKEQFPFIVCKWAQSLDGFIALSNFQSKYLTSEEARSDVHLDRQLFQNILIGGETLRQDDPKLDCRLYNYAYVPNRFVLVSLAKLEHVNYQIFQDSHREKTYVLTQSSDDLKHVANKELLLALGVHVFEYDFLQISLREMFQDLYAKNFVSFYVEAGKNLKTSLMNENLIDEYIVYIAPKLF
ncbi:MAG: bifunctional diaminohydroxyphosphoribosylaminopyrimidine deaminase/5-amino-6-(5-phosphoribosylamino)uracil reductase RibD, partial [Bacteriovoracaceae bacterium]|nr:bifunctional diaminohydroxyphosphoribosylaminopyrimidine deaminase/5-amino-6-(5-phosphoribosylamino)uracil reductase RibD [Bacteriovoracaceae bacterium]